MQIRRTKIISRVENRTLNLMCQGMWWEKSRLFLKSNFRSIKVVGTVLAIEIMSARLFICHALSGFLVFTDNFASGLYFEIKMSNCEVIRLRSKSNNFNKISNFPEIDLPVHVN